MDLIWTMLRCPIYGKVREDLIHHIENKPEPWRSHAISCLITELISPAETLLIVGIGKQSGIVAFVWLSLPDRVILRRENAWAFLFHVHVALDFRGRGIGAQLVRWACAVAELHDVQGVLLATDNQHLRQGFYYKLGFRPVTCDPWLMEYRTKKNQAVVSTPGSIALPLGSLRSVSHHDLATVQSICAHEHWFCTFSSVKTEKPKEMEEDFCSLLLKDGQSKQFIISGQFAGAQFVSWFVQDSNKWSQRILYKEINNKQAHVLSKQVANAVSAVCQYTNDELHMIETERLLLFD